jgi:starvation-inducible outer membrane lipoprotein
MKAALLLALLALAACAAAPRAAHAAEDKPIPKSCNAVEAK